MFSVFYFKFSFKLWILESPQLNLPNFPSGQRGQNFTGGMLYLGIVRSLDENVKLSETEKGIDVQGHKNGRKGRELRTIQQGLSFLARFVQ